MFSNISFISSGISSDRHQNATIMFAFSKNCDILSSSQICRSTVSSVFLHRFPYLIKMNPQYTGGEKKRHCNKSSEILSLNAKPVLQPSSPQIIHSVHWGFYISSRNEGQHVIKNSLRQTEWHHQHSPADITGFSITLLLTLFLLSFVKFNVHSDEVCTRALHSKISGSLCFCASIHLYRKPFRYIQPCLLICSEMSPKKWIVLLVSRWSF